MTNWLKCVGANWLGSHPHWEHWQELCGPVVRGASGPVPGGDWPDYGINLMINRVGNLLSYFFCFLLFCSKSFILKSDCEWWIPYFSSLKRETVRESLMSIGTVKEWLACDLSELLSKMSNSNVSFPLFLTVFYWSPNFVCPRAYYSRHSSLSHSFLKKDESRTMKATVALHKRVTMSKSLLWLFTKEQLLLICSRCPRQKSDWSDLLFFMSESLFC